MDDIKKLFVSVYIALFAGTMLAAFWNGLGVIDLKEGTISLMLWGFSVAIIPAAITAFRAQDFWKDDPNSVAKLKRLNSEEVGSLKKEIAKIKSEHLEAERKRLNRPTAEIVKPSGDFPVIR